jgi:hypothetical protein
MRLANSSSSIKPRELILCNPHWEELDLSAIHLNLRERMRLRFIEIDLSMKFSIKMPFEGNIALKRGKKKP